MIISSRGGDIMEINQAIDMIKKSSAFIQKLQTNEIENGKVNGNFFGILDDEFLHSIAREAHLYTATIKKETCNQDEEYFEFGKVITFLRIVDEKGHGFETTI
jgi:hypothetical protein